MRGILTLLICSIASFVQAGGFDSYEWRQGFKLADAEYQPTLKIEYNYHGEW